jgi:hypothetical protein
MQARLGLISSYPPLHTKCQDPSTTIHRLDFINLNLSLFSRLCTRSYLIDPLPPGQAYHSSLHPCTVSSYPVHRYQHPLCYITLALFDFVHFPLLVHTAVQFLNSRRVSIHQVQGEKTRAFRIPLLLSTSNPLSRT